jgi:hypothetical protein
MKVIRHEDGITLVPESDYERECLKVIYGKALKTVYEDSWNRTGNLKLEFNADPWSSNH